MLCTFQLPLTVNNFQHAKHVWEIRKENLQSGLREDQQERYLTFYDLLF